MLFKYKIQNKTNVYISGTFKPEKPESLCHYVLSEVSFSKTTEVKRCDDTTKCSVKCNNVEFLNLKTIQYKISIYSPGVSKTTTEIITLCNLVL